MKLMLLSIIIVLATLILGVQLEACIDPNKEPGYCVLLAQCPELSNKLTSENYRRFVSESRCGYDRDQLPRVCCAQPATGNLNYFPDLFPSVGVCGIEVTLSVSNRVAGGEDASLFQHPWSVLLINEKKRGRNALYCGGALINRLYVLTAAHCLHEETENEYSRISVRLGEHRISTPIDCELNSTTVCTQPTDVMVEKKIIHQSFHPQGLQNDIALVKLAQPVSYTNFIKPICLPQTADLQFYETHNVTFEVTGWGKTAFNDNLSDTKKIIQLYGVNNTYCNKKFQTLNPPMYITDNQICAGGENGKDTCRGDSGSPLVGYGLDANRKSYFYLAGISSYGLGKCGTANWPGVYTTVWKYLTWIVETIKVEQIYSNGGYNSTKTTPRLVNPVRRVINTLRF